MDRKSTSEEAQGLSADDLCDHRQRTADGDPDGSRAAASLTRVGGRRYFLEASYVGGFEAADPLPLLETIFSSRSPGAGQPGIFLGFARGERRPEAYDEPTGGEVLIQNDLRQYHDSESGDIYDLYNACNGATRDGLLDVRKLDELSAEEREALDVERLRGVWEHTATGCVTCARIIRTLNAARRILRDDETGAPDGEA